MCKSKTIFKLVMEKLVSAYVLYDKRHSWVIPMTVDTFNDLFCSISVSYISDFHTLYILRLKILYTKLLNNRPLVSAR